MERIQRKNWIKIGLLLFTFFFLGCILYLFRQAVLPFFIAVAFAYLIAPIITKMNAFRIKKVLIFPRWISILLVYLVLAFFIYLFSTRLLPTIRDEMVSLVNEAPKIFLTIKKSWVPHINKAIRNLQKAISPTPSEGQKEKKGEESEDEAAFKILQRGDGLYHVFIGANGLEILNTGKNRYVIQSVNKKEQAENRVFDLEKSIDRYFNKLQESASGYLSYLLVIIQKIISGALSAFVTLLVIFMGAAFILVDPEKFLNFFRSIVPKKYGFDCENIIQRLDVGLAGVVRGQIIICVINGILTGIGVAIIMKKFSIIFGILAGFFSLIPIFGSILSSIPIVAVGLAQKGSPELGLYLLIWILGIHFIEANFLNPKIIGTAAKIHPFLVIFALVVGERSYGLAGAIFAVPILCIIQTFFVYAREKIYEGGTEVVPVVPKEGG